MKTLYLLDGHAHFFRAYHAIRTPMTSPVTGEPTNATFGFVGLILKLLRERKPDYIAVAIDVSGDRGTFRSDIFADYKANRDAPPEDLGPQIRRCIDVLNEIGIPVLGVERYEADDVIATLATHLKAEPDLRVRIVSKDKDLQQLIETDRVDMYDPYNDDLMDEAWLRETKGITPAQVVDMLALMGDNVDNVPGVPGIGPKTAAQLIAQYGTLDALLDDADNIKGKRGENIRAAVDVLPVSKELVQLAHDVPIELELPHAHVATALHLDRLAPLLRELGFRRYEQELRDLLAGGDPDADAPETRATPTGTMRSSPDGQGSLFGAEEAAQRANDWDGEYETITTTDQLQTLIERARKADMLAIDTETSALGAMTADLCGVSLSIAPATGAYIPVRSPNPESHLSTDDVIAALKTLLEDERLPKCGHNLKFDLLVLRRHGAELKGPLFDSMIASYLIDASRSSHSLDNLALAFLNHSCMPISELIGSGRKQKRFDEVALDVAGPYAAEDADIALRLHDHLIPQLRAMKLGGLFAELEMPLVEALAELEWNGITVDPAELDAQAERLAFRIKELKTEIEVNAPHPFNPDSPKQLQAALFNPPDHIEFPGLGIKPLKKTKTGYSTDAEVLEKLAADQTIDSPIPRLIVEHRTLTKLVSTYLVALKEAINPSTGRIHASFNQTVAATGRLSSSDPNLQNIPIRTDVGREIRKAFVASEGRVLIAADYSQIELRLLAHLAQDEALIEAFRGGADIHRAVAAEIHAIDADDVTSDQRSGAKMVNFGIVYGITPFGLARRLGIEQKAAASIIEGYMKRFPGITVFLRECIDEAKANGYVETMMKRRRPIRDIESRNPARRSLAERMAINSVVQGSAADLIKKAMVDIHAALRGPHADRLPTDWRDRRDDVMMLLQIHDELVFEAPEELGESVQTYITTAMAEAMQIDVPLVVDSAIGKNWFEGK